MAGLNLPFTGSLSSGNVVFGIDCDGGGGTAIRSRSIGSDQGGFGGTGLAASAEAGGVGVSSTVSGLDRDGLGGVGVQAESAGGIGVQGVASDADRDGPGVGVEGFGPVGVLAMARDPQSIAIQAVGPASQDRASGGFVKAMVYMAAQQPDIVRTIKRAFNSQILGGFIDRPPNAGITANRVDRGAYVIDFGFQVNDRYVCAIAESRPSGTNPEDPNTRLPSFDPFSPNFVIINTSFPASTQVLVVLYAPNILLSGTGGAFVEAGFLSIDANFTVFVF